MAAARTALAGLPLMYVHLHLERVRQPQALSKDNNTLLRRGTAFNAGQSPARDQILNKATEIETYLTMVTWFLQNTIRPGAVDKPVRAPVDQRCAWLLEHVHVLESTEAGLGGLSGIAALYADARRLLGLTRYVQVMVAPCPACDMRALVRDVDGPHVRCEVCGHQLDERGYLDWAETHRGGA